MATILLVVGILPFLIGISQCELMKIRACEGHKMIFFCGTDEIINVFWANYGRTDNTFCHYFDDIEASADCRMDEATDIVKKKCNGKQKCFIEAINDIFGDPCPSQVKYAEAIYECVQKPRVKLDPNDLTVEMQEKELLEILKDLGEKDSRGQDLKPEQALGLLNLFANAEADAKSDDEDNAANPRIW